MPRIYDSRNNPLDFCQDCFPSEEVAEKQFKNLGDGPDGRGNCFGFEAEHPPYEDTEYRCEGCREYLREADN